MRVAFQVNGKYLVAENGGDDAGVVHANRTAIGPWETWTLERQDDGRVALKSVNGRYLSAEGGGGGDVHANRTAVGPWERWTIVSNADGTISLQSDNGHFLSARLDQPNIPVNATVTSAGPFEAFTEIVIESDTPRVSVSGSSFVDENGRPWIWRGTTDFLLFMRYLNGEDVRALLAERFAVGARLVRILSMCDNIAHFHPQEHPDYYDRLGPFLDLAAQSGFYVEITVFADAQIVMSDTSQQRAHLSRIVDTVRPRTNAFVELANEYAKNGVDPRLFQKPDGVVSSHGSGLTDQPPAQPPWDYLTFHARRDVPKAWNDVNPDSVRWPPGPPWVTDEMMKAGVDVSDPQRFFQAGVFAGLANGATFHSQEGVESRSFSPIVRACAEAFFRGLAVVVAS